MRKVHIDGEEWQYVVGKSCGVSMIAPGGRKIYVDGPTFCNMTPGDLDRALRERYGPAIGPGDVKAWIIDHPEAFEPGAPSSILWDWRK